MSDAEINFSHRVAEALAEMRSDMASKFPHPTLFSEEAFNHTEMQSNFLLNCRILAIELEYAQILIVAAGSLSDKVTHNKTKIKHLRDDLQEFYERNTEKLVDLNKIQYEEIPKMLPMAISYAFDIEHTEIAQAMNDAENPDDFLGRLSGILRDSFTELEDEIDEVFNTPPIAEQTSGENDTVPMSNFWHVPLYDRDSAMVTRGLSILDNSDGWQFWHKLFSDLSNGTPPQFKILHEIN